MFSKKILRAFDLHDHLGVHNWTHVKYNAHPFPGSSFAGEVYYCECGACSRFPTERLCTGQWSHMHSARPVFDKCQVMALPEAVRKKAMVVMSKLYAIQQQLHDEEVERANRAIPRL